MPFSCNRGIYVKLMSYILTGGGPHGTKQTYNIYIHIPEALLQTKDC